MNEEFVKYDINEDQFYDLVIVGSGAAAKAASAEARRQGKSVILVERGVIGGTCLNVGCVPSKSLLAAAAVRSTAGSARFPGIATSEGPVDLSLLVKDKDEYLAALRDRDHVEGAAQQGVTILEGNASFTPSAAGKPTLIVTRGDGDEARVVAEQVIIATGAEPFIPDIPGLQDVDYLTSSTAMSLSHLPGSLLVVGGNAVGLEQAQLFARLGVKVTVVELAPRIAPSEDPSISVALQEALTGEGIVIKTGMTLTGVERSDSGVLATVRDGDGPVRIPAEKILIATGRRPVTEGLNLSAINVAVGPRGEVVVDEHLRTSHPRVWAAGDVTGTRQFAYVALAQGALAAANAFGTVLRTLDYGALPRVTFTSPAVAAVGMTAADADAAGLPYECRELPLTHVPRANLSRDTRGLVRILSDPETHQLLGVHMVGDEAGEVITAATYALTAGFTLQQLAGTWAPSFTMAESLKIAAMMPPLPAN
jgi:mercuric reductase